MGILNSPTQLPIVKNYFDSWKNWERALPSIFFSSAHNIQSIYPNPQRDQPLQILEKPNSVLFSGNNCANLPKNGAYFPCH